MKIAILGPGAIGGFLAAAFWKKGFEVICVATESSAPILEKNGIDIQSAALGNFVARPKVVTNLDEPVDFLFVATKANNLKDALKRINPQFVGIVIPLLNGFEHMEVLRNYFGKKVVAGAISIYAERNREGKVLHHSLSNLVTMASKDISEDKLQAVADLLKASGLEVKILNTESEVLWNKLVRLNAISGVTAASGKDLGFCRANPGWRSLLEGSVKEGCAVALKEGVDIDSQKVIQQIDGFLPSLRTSMARDIDGGKESELDFIAGAIVRAGKKYGLECPTIQELISRVTRRLNNKKLKVLGVVGIRSGSKGVLHKNIRPLAGKPLVGWILDTAKNSKYINRLVVSTDSEDYAKVARQFGAEVPYLRPAELAQEKSPELDYVKHLVEWLDKNEGYKPDIVVRMMATVPLQLAGDLDAVVEELIKDPEAHSAVVIAEARQVPHKALKLVDDGNGGKHLVSYFGNSGREVTPIARQNYEKAYFRANVIAFRPEVIQNTNSLTGDRVRYHIIPQERAMDIDSEIDFYTAEQLIEKFNKK